MVRNPFNVPEIRDIIFKYLNNADLLHCRLVSHTWAKECLYLLNKSNACTIGLTKSNINSYLEFISSFNITSIVFKYTINFEDCSNNDEVTQMLGRVGKLLEIFGPTCIQNLNITVPSNLQESTWELLYQLLQMIGPGLVKLEIMETQVYDQNSWLVVVFYPTLDWPKLLGIITETLSVRECDQAFFPPDMNLGPFKSLTSFARRFGTHPEFIRTVISGAPKLKSLELLGSMDETLPIRETSNLLGFLTRCLETQTSLEHLELLGLGLGDETSYQAISAFQLPNLKSLKIHIIETILQADAQLLSNFLRDNCPG